MRETTTKLRNWNKIIFLFFSFFFSRKNEWFFPRKIWGKIPFSQPKKGETWVVCLRDCFTSQPLAILFINILADKIGVNLLQIGCEIYPPC